MLNKVAIGLTVSFSFIASGDEFSVACKISNPNKMDSYGDPETLVRISGEWRDDTLIVSPQAYVQALQLCLQSRAHIALRNYDAHIRPDSPEMDSWSTRPVVWFWLGRYSVLPQEDKSEIRL